MKKIIGILPTYRFEETDSPYDDVYKFVPLYSIKIHEAGGLPIGILLNDKKLDMDVLDMCDGFIIPGGNKVYDFLFEVINYCIKKNKPILGICLGAEAIAIFSEIYEKTKNQENFLKVYSEIEQETEGAVLNKLDDSSMALHSRHYSRFEPDSAKHIIKPKEGSHIFNIYGDSKNVASMHSFDFRKIGEDFEVTATASDGVSECIEYKDKNYFIVGVHFHPEVEEDNKIFEFFMNEVNKRSNN
ncbi:MAG: homoserine O-succinyltransferase [Clostridia bacterium]|nr:homoserine O-succinyltransferase [Clostridia bacterium]